MFGRKNQNSEELLDREPFFKGVHVVELLVLALLALNGLALYGILFSPQGVFGYRLQTLQVRQLEEKVTKLRRENHRLYSRIQSLKNDSKAQERLVRQHLGWVRENELLVEFPPLKR